MAAPLANLLITAASESYRAQLLALLGSLRCNWPNHPPVRVYDLGLSEGTRKALERAGFEVRLVPPFIPHWRKHYTWKLWCLNEPEAERVLWLDAGCCVLRPVPEIFDVIESQGYFGLPNHEQLEREASEAACEGCRVDVHFRTGKSTVTAAVFGFKAGSPAHDCVREALEVAKTERFIEATKPWHRWEQAILSLLLYRDIEPLILCDSATYFYEDLSAKFTTHAIWAARRGMHYKDKRFFESRLMGPTQQHRPRPSHKLELWYRTAWQSRVMMTRLFGKGSVVPNGVK